MGVLSNVRLDILCDIRPDVRPTIYPDISPAIRGPICAHLRHSHHVERSAVPRYLMDTLAPTHHRAFSVDIPLDGPRQVDFMKILDAHGASAEVHEVIFGPGQVATWPSRTFHRGGYPLQILPSLPLL